MYIKETFDVVTFDQAKDVVLSGGATDHAKFERETKHLIDAIRGTGAFKAGDSILDLGCGMGRVSRELVHALGCDVIGVDISPSMLRFAELYVAKPDRFRTASRWTEPASVDGCLAALVLQHAEDPIAELANVREVLRPGGTFVLLNENKRMVPGAVDEERFVEWIDDGIDVIGAADGMFERVGSVPYVCGEKSIITYRKG